MGAKLSGCTIAFYVPDGRCGMIVSIPDHCLPFYFVAKLLRLPSGYCSWTARVHTCFVVGLSGCTQYMLGSTTYAWIQGVHVHSVHNGWIRPWFMLKSYKYRICMLGQYSYLNKKINVFSINSVPICTYMYLVSSETSQSIKLYKTFQATVIARMLSNWEFYYTKLRWRDAARALVNLFVTGVIIDIR